MDYFKQISDSLDKTSAPGGCQYILAGAPILADVKINRIVILTAAEVDILLGGVATDSDTNFKVNIGIQSVTLPAGTEIFPPTGSYFRTFQLNALVSGGAAMIYFG